MDIRWTSAFLDLAPGQVESGAAFWSAVTGYDASAVADEGREFPPLRPPEGDAYVYVQRVGDAPSRVHLDLHVDDLDRAVAGAVASGAELLDRRDHAVLRSPRGLAFCLVLDPGAARPAPARWPGGHSSRIDQLCLDVPHSGWAEECAFWAALSGAAVRPTDDGDYVALDVADDLPLRLLLQRRRDDEGATRAHLDVGTPDREAETARHRALGAEVVAVLEEWTVLRDPNGTAYCVTDDAPAAAAAATATEV